MRLSRNQFVTGSLFPVRRGSPFRLPDSVVELSSFWESGGKMMDEKVLGMVFHGFCHRVAVISTRLGLNVLVAVVRTQLGSQPVVQQQRSQSIASTVTSHGISPLG